MHGAGNDYIYVNSMLHDIPDPVHAAIFMSDRHKGIGSDGLVLIGNSPVPEADYSMRIFNADGIDALDITCANFTLADGATAKFGNRTEGDTKNLTVSGTITNPTGCTFSIHAANQNGAGSVLATITCTKLMVGGDFPGGKPQVVAK